MKVLVTEGLKTTGNFNTEITKREYKHLLNPVNSTEYAMVEFHTIKLFLENDYLVCEDHANVPKGHYNRCEHIIFKEVGACNASR